jgi:ABC-type transport system involved in multi-copper enzyme maturation permease subunit
MLSLYNIWNVARIETKTLFRSWFFRIFAILSLVILGFMNFGILTQTGNTPWMFRGIPAAIPYMNLILLNVVQAVIAIFLASDFLKRDKKLDTTEVIYMRSMTNGDYVIGKAIGIVFVFLTLNILVLLVAAVFNIFFTDVPFKLIAYLIYPALIGLPTLFFILGLSFIMMAAIRNQAVTFIVLLGYIAITLFFIGTKYFALFDYMGFNIPFMYSDFIGFGNLDELLIHRSIYFTLGLACIFGTIYLIKRLPQSQVMTKTSYVLSIVFLFVGLTLAYKHVSRIFHAKNLRKQIVALNSKYESYPRLTPTDYQIRLKHTGEQIEGEVSISFENNTQESINNYLFNLNPGLKVEQVTQDGSPLTFTQDISVLQINPEDLLPPNNSAKINISYKGTINEEANYIDVPEEEREKAYRAFIYNVDKRYSFITPDYVLLTPENQWYPTPGVRFHPDHPEALEENFTNFKLVVEASKNLLAISQGVINEAGPGRFEFKPEYPLKGISVAIGSYQKRSVTVDSVDYNLYTLTNHDYFVPYFTELGDTLSTIIRETKQDYENKLNLPYLFKRLNLVETPVQYFTYPRLYTVGQESVQPEMVLLSENGVFLENADFPRFKSWEDRRRERSNRVYTEKETQSQLLRRFITGTFTSGFQMRFRFGGPPMPSSYTSIFPNYFSQVINVESKQWPVFKIAIESFVYDRVKEQSSPFAQMFTGMSDEDKTNQALQENNMEEILGDPDKADIVQQVLTSKGAYLFLMMQSRIGEETFQNYLALVFRENRFQDVRTVDFIASLQEKFNFDFKPYVENWYNSKQLPAYLISNIEAYKVLDEDRTRSQILFKATNTEPIDGILKASFRGGGGRGGFGPPGGGSEDEVVRYIPFKGNQTKEVGFVLDFEPRGINLSTLISKNLPASVFHRFEELEENKKAQPFDGERTLDAPVTLALPNEIIVDNEDPGFEILTQPKRGALSGLFERFRKEDTDKYIGIRYWNPPKQWRAGTFSDFYGKHVHSAHFVKSGDGDKIVAWNADLKENGFYDIYYYVSRVRNPFMRRRGGGGDGDRRDEQGEYHFKIFHDDGIEEATLDMDNAELGWTFLGSFYISAGKAKVELNNDSKARLVFADAVKWVKR